MDRLTFGDGTSPFVAMATLHRTAQDYGGTDQRAVSAIRENFDMDDMNFDLDSFDSPSFGGSYPGGRVGEENPHKRGLQPHQVDIRFT